MKARLLSVLITLTLAAGCAQAFHETRPASQQEEAAPKMYSNPYKNPETEEEYQRRIEWENRESEWPRFFRR